MTVPNVRTPAAGPANAEEQGTVAGADFATADEWRAAVAEREKRLSTVRAELAFKAIVVHVVADGFLACRWGYCRTLATIDALESFAVQVGARASA
jgi:hypothetical protein